jgi:hypothetical protein
MVSKKERLLKSKIKSGRDEMNVFCPLCAAIALFLLPGLENFPIELELWQKSREKIIFVSVASKLLLFLRA